MRFTAKRVSLARGGYLSEQDGVGIVRLLVVHGDHHHHPVVGVLAGVGDRAAEAVELHGAESATTCQRTFILWG
jgi:hypothetical protein